MNFGITKITKCTKVRKKQSMHVSSSYRNSIYFSPFHMNVILETEQSKQIERNRKIKVFILRNVFLVYRGLGKLISLSM